MLAPSILSKSTLNLRHVALQRALTRWRCRQAPGRACTSGRWTLQLHCPRSDNLQQITTPPTLWQVGEEVAQLPEVDELEPEFEHDVGIDTSRLTPKMVETIEYELCLEAKPNWSFEKRAAQAAEAVMRLRQQLREAANGNILNGAVERRLMQAVNVLLGEIKVGNRKAGEWLTQWRSAWGRDLGEEFDSMQEGRGWLSGILMCKTRLAATGGSAIGVKSATRSGRELRARLELDKALEAIKEADNDRQFDDWYA